MEESDREPVAAPVSDAAQGDEHRSKVATAAELILTRHAEALQRLG